MRILILGCMLIGFLSTKASDDYVYIDSISIEGNKKTRSEIILRELVFAVGDTIAIDKLKETLTLSEQMVMNTGLFNGVNISFRNWKAISNSVHVQIVVEETWYIFPFPVFELADRNFNVWWVEQDRSFQRINFGVEFTHLNFTGRKDRIKLKTKYGYTRNYSLGYSIPYINPAQTLGISGNVSFSRNREINYGTVGNKQEFFKNDDRFIYQRFEGGLGLRYRPQLLSTHHFIVRYFQNSVTERVAKELNPEFFLRGRELQRYVSFTYEFSHDTRDVRPYPLSGHKTSVTVEKDGLGLFDDRNGLTLSLRYDHYFPLSSRWSFGLNTSGKLSLIRRRQPYNDNRALGFGRDFLHGYEYYVVDGLDMVYLKSLTRFRLINKKVNFGSLMPIDAYRSMPVRLYLTLNQNIGYANDPFEKEVNFLNNRLLWGGGIALDIVLFYDKVIRIEYSVNHLLENGLFLHLNMNI